MGWLQSSLVTIGLLTGTGSQAAAPPVASPAARPGPADVVASCDDFVRVTGQVFTGRSGATFRVGTISDDLAGDTFGPTVLNIGGVDPARYLHQHCG